MPPLHLHQLQFTYTTTQQQVLGPISLTWEAGQVHAIMGESGCGKSTLLQLVYGLLDPEPGSLLWGDTPIIGPAHRLIPGTPGMAYLAQDFDLMPYTTVAENVGQYLSNTQPQAKRNRVMDLLEVVDMVAFADTKVKWLSGGQMQRVALARALSVTPQWLLLDEPFSHIDTFRKNALRQRLFAFLRSEGIGCLLATHDMTDVLSYADTALVLQHGKALAYDKVAALYARPPHPYVAGLFSEFTAWETETGVAYVFPHQLQFKPQEQDAYEVMQAYFKGSHWVLQCQKEGHTAWVQHPTEVAQSTRGQVTRLS